VLARTLKILACTSKKGRIMAKYKNKKIEIDGIVFDSKKEARRYQELKLLEKAGRIQNLQLQVKFVLIPKQYSKTDFTKAGKPRLIEHECSYLADFVYSEDGQTIVEDVKSSYTRNHMLYVVKRKLMLYVHGIRIKEI